MKPTSITVIITVLFVNQGINGQNQQDIDERNKGIEPSDFIAFERYNRFCSIEKWMYTMHNQPQTGPSGRDMVMSEVEIIGTTIENRNIPMIKIFKRPNRKYSFQRRKYAILIDGGIHAREWISPAVVINLINELKNNPSNCPDIEKLVDWYDWYIIPVLNPDGYVYSFTTDPGWRKNRKVSSTNASCVGIDLNRNFGYKWNPAIGGSDDPCSNKFSGESPFSERESQALRHVMARNTNGQVNFLAYLTFHNWSQYIVYPWGYTNESLPDAQDLRNAGLSFAAAIKSVHNTDYIVEQSAKVELFGLIAGASDDYARGGAKIKYSYTVELRDKGEKGFYLPASEIKPTSEEILFGVKTLAVHLRNAPKKIPQPYRNNHYG